MRVSGVAWCVGMWCDAASNLALSEHGCVRVFVFVRSSKHGWYVAETWLECGLRFVVDDVLALFGCFLLLSFGVVLSGLVFGSLYLVLLTWGAPVRFGVLGLFRVAFLCMSALRGEMRVREWWQWYEE